LPNRVTLANLTEFCDATLAELSTLQPEAGWTCTGAAYNANLTRSDGLSIHIGLDKHVFGRVYIEANNLDLHKYLYTTDEVWPRISVDGNRGPQVAAKDIIRRLLPTWELMREELIARMVVSDTYNGGVAHLAERLSDLGFGGSPDARWRYMGTMKVQTQGPDNVTMEVSCLPFEALVRFLEVLREEFPGAVLR
jgi:hypothetical protein